MIQGNIQGVRQSALDALDALFNEEMPPDQFAPLPLVEKMAAFTGRTGREVSTYLRRDGKIVSITVGDAHTVSLEEVHLRRNEDRLAGVRCIHTHPGGNAHLSDVDISALKRLKLDAIAAVGVKEDGAASAMSIAFLDPEKKGDISYHGPYGMYQIPQEELLAHIAQLDQHTFAQENSAQHGVERAILVGLGSSAQEPALLELKRLAETAGAQVVAVTHQPLRSPDPATYIGSGKAAEVALAIQALECTLAIIDDELSGAQIRNLEEIFGVKVVDRSALILDIFAQHATSREGKLQVELAQHKYRLPRLTGMGVSMSRQGAGIAARGPGETKLETDRRRIRESITDISKELQKVAEQRAQRRVRRESNRVPVVALVGYTNAGKSTLLNYLTNAGVLSEDKLFATLDTTTRQLELPSGGHCLLTDTVGFIDKLPHDLVNAFRSTLEEALIADLLVIVADNASPDAVRQLDVVQEVLLSLGAKDSPKLVALNKADQPAGDASFSPKEGMPISAKVGTGIEALLVAIEKELSQLRHSVQFFIPYDKGAALALLHREGAVQSEVHQEEGTLVMALLDEVLEERVRRML